MAKNTQQPTDAEESALNGLDLYEENVRLNKLNGKLVLAVAKSGTISVAAIIFALVSLFVKPDPERVAVDPAGRAFPLQMLTKGNPPDAKITRMVSDCATDLLNHAFHNYQTTVERAIGQCFTDAGSASIRTQIDPLLARMKTEQLNMATTFVIQPFINRRMMEYGRNVFQVQAVVQIGYRGRSAQVTPVTYTLECDVVRVPYDQNIEGIRLQNVVLKIRA